MAKTLNNISGMPKMKAAFAGWFKSLTLQVVTQTIDEGFVTDDMESVTFKGTIQPLSKEELRLKPEGQRSWEWLQIHCLSGSLNLTTNDRICYNEKIYKVMALKDYSLNNYIEYHLVADYEEE
ncbi:hypothetical protein [uncultured Paraglaciecola sp.]|uniref:hypothetical protein n=1 Tax=uncultured Paraglaciecola sp. TaxID=1765024 RepID=UPI0026129105|nr:hypothetical protein [uncultured Paraglaciecola sp.]